MKGDFTRLTHRPLRGYARVLMQQGRVTLDADWNEQRDIDARRWRLQTLDTVGPACAPQDAAGFGLEPTPDGRDLVIGPGRMYVGGQLVENLPGTPVEGRVGHGEVAVGDAAPDGVPFADGQWVEVVSGAGTTLARVDRVAGSDETGGAVLHLSGGPEDDGEVRVRRVTTYLTQPFLPADAPDPFGAPLSPQDWQGRAHLAYLDVWERHVTAVEDPGLREVALGGPDTATRVQVAWAVRLLRDGRGEPVDVGAAGCGVRLEEWDELVRPAGGRMSARAEAAPDPTSPCLVPPEAGYRGLENRLYRVEIHDPGPLGTATFVWSRDNGTVLTAVRDMLPGAPFRVAVSSLGRDWVLRFRAGDVVEVESDVSELAGLPGTLAEVDGLPDEARRLVPLDTDVSAYDGHPHVRLRRWDHAGPAPLTTGSWVELEEGVQVRFSGGTFRTGDWWVVPARSAVGDVEGFADAPPRGVSHDYARLGIVTWAGEATQVRDCRSTFPTLCGFEGGGGSGCCTVTVGDGVVSHGDVDDLAEAVASVQDLEGAVRICLLPGDHRVDARVVVRRSRLTISGCGTQAPVTSARGGVLGLHRVSAVRLENLVLRSTGDEPTVVAVRVDDLSLDRCDVLNLGERDAGGRDAGERPPRGAPRRLAGFTPLRGLDRFAGDSLTATGIKDAGPALVATASTGLAVRECSLRGNPGLLFQGARLAVVDSVVLGGGPRRSHRHRRAAGQPAGRQSGCGSPAGPARRRSAWCRGRCRRGGRARPGGHRLPDRSRRRRAGALAGGRDRRRRGPRQHDLEVWARRRGHGPAARGGRDRRGRGAGRARQPDRGLRSSADQPGLRPGRRRPPPAGHRPAGRAQRDQGQRPAQGRARAGCVAGRRRVRLPWTHVAGQRDP